MRSDPRTEASAGPVSGVRWMGRILRWLGVGMVCLWVFEYWNVFQPRRGERAKGDEFGVDPERVWLRTEDGKLLRAWYYPARSGGRGAEWAVLVAHGNGGNLSDRVGLYEAWHSLGVAVLGFDYRGYGDSRGWPSESGTYRDACAAHQWLVEHGFAPHRIVAHGESLGGGVVAELARRRTLGGLVLHSTFARITDVGADWFPYLPVRWLARIRYAPVDRLPEIQVPVLVLHSRADSLIPFSHAERNYAAARPPKSLREIAGDHNDQPEADPLGFRGAIGEFLEGLLARDR